MKKIFASLLVAVFLFVSAPVHATTTTATSTSTGARSYYAPCMTDNVLGNCPGYIAPLAEVLHWLQYKIGMSKGAIEALFE